MIPYINHNVGAFLSDLRDGDHFNYNGLEFVRLGEEQGGILCITSAIWSKSIFNRYERPTWHTSEIKEELYRKVLRITNRDDILPMTLDLTPVSLNLLKRGLENTRKEEIGILSLEQCKKYKSVMPNYGQAIWTCSPDYYYPYYFNAVHPDGIAESFQVATCSLGYAPVLLFRKEEKQYSTQIFCSTCKEGV